MRPISTLKDRQEAFYNELVPYVDKYTPDLVRSFYDYWSEPNQTGTKMRWELEKTWDTAKRIARWQRNERQPVEADNSDLMKQWYREDQERQRREEEAREESKKNAVSYEVYLKMKEEGKI